MGEREPPGVQELAVEPGLVDAVHGVAGYGQTDRGEVDPDLVRSAGLEAHIEQGMAVEQALDLEVGDGVARRLRVERHPRGLAAVAADRRLDLPAPRARPAA